jgi:hypothetical protein
MKSRLFNKDTFDYPITVNTGDCKFYYLDFTDAEQCLPFSLFNFDEKEIPFRNYKIGKQYNPFFIALYAFLNWQKYYKTRKYQVKNWNLNGVRSPILNSS